MAKAIVTAAMMAKGNLAFPQQCYTVDVYIQNLMTPRSDTRITEMNTDLAVMLRSFKESVAALENTENFEYARQKLEAVYLWALINNAGVCVYGDFERQTDEQLRRQVDVNVLGTMRLTRAFIPLLRIKKGRIITVSSVNGSIAYPGIAAYCATKSYLEGLSHSIRLELGLLHGMKVIIIQPGDFAKLTNIMSQQQKNFDEMWNNMSQDDQAQYGDDFRRKHRAALQNCGYTSPQRIEDSSLLDDMKDALLNVNPCLRYISAEFKYRIFYRLLEYMPYWMVDLFLTKVMNKLMKQEKQ